MTTHWKCCCGCSPGGPFKAGVISYSGEIGHQSSFGSGNQSGGFRSSFHQSSEKGLVDEILSASSDTEGDGEKEDAVMSVIKQSCVLAIGSTDWGQVHSTNPGEPASWARYPSQKDYAVSHFFMPDASASEETFDGKVTKAISDKVCKEGALLVILGGNPKKVVEEYSADGGCGENWGQSFLCGDSGSSGTSYCTEGVNHVDEINDFLDKMREHDDYEEPVGYTKLVYTQDNLKEHADTYGSDLHNNLKIHEFINCSTVGAGCEEEDCPDVYDQNCDVCGPYGGIGREIHMHWNYNLFKVGLTEIDEVDPYKSATWLNDPEEDDYDSLLHLQDQISGKVTGGRWVHDKENIDGYEITNTGYALEKFGKGHVLVWGCPTTFMSGLNSTSYNRELFGGFVCGYSGSSCGNASAPVPVDKYGYWPYNENSHLLARIIDKIIGKEVEALV